MFYKFDSIEQFNEWHTAIKIQLDIPRADGITTRYTDLYEREGQLFALIDDDLADGFTPFDLPPANSIADVRLVKKVETQA
jgi:hypothetical protein